MGSFRCATLRRLPLVLSGSNLDGADSGVHPKCDAGSAKMTAGSIFSEPGHWQQNELNEEVGSGWDLYSIAYKDGADRLVEQFADWPDGEFYAACPIMFLYRHYLELKLKELVIRLDHWHGVADDFTRSRPRRTPVPFSVPGHKLRESWEMVRSLLEQMSDEFLSCGVLDEFVTGYDEIEARVSDFDRLDRSSMMFRYPTDRKGVPHGVRLPDRTALDRVKTVVEAIASDLDAIGVAVGSSEEDVRLEFDSAVDGYYLDLHTDSLR